MSRKGGDSLDATALLLEKGLEIETLNDKISRLQKRSDHLEAFIQREQTSTKDMEGKLEEMINSLSSQQKHKETRVYDLEQAWSDLKIQHTRAIEKLTVDMIDLQNTHKLMTEDLRQQLLNAEHLLHEIEDFNARKSEYEQHINSLKQALELERTLHIKAVHDTERAIQQDKERLKTEMMIRIEDTKKQMLMEIDDQLDAKTKKTIAENDQLDTELQYHVKQSELLLQKNAKLSRENVELHHQVVWAKEVETELARRNHMNQRTIRILVYKLGEGEHPEEMHDGHDFGTLTEQQDLLNSFIEEHTKSIESQGGAEQAMKFLYACLQDIEHQKTTIDEVTPPSEVIPNMMSENGEAKNPEPSLNLPSSLDQMTNVQRQELLMHLLRTALSLRAVEQTTSAVSIDDILKIPVEGMVKDESVSKAGASGTTVSIAIQTDSVKLEEKLAPEIHPREKLELMQRNYRPHSPNFRPHSPNFRPHSPNFRPHSPNFRPHSP